MFFHCILSDEMKKNVHSLRTGNYKAQKLGNGGWGVAYRILVSAPVPFGLIWVFNWVGLGSDWVWGDLGQGGLGFGTRA